MFFTLTLLSAAAAICIHTHKSTKKVENECSDYFWTTMDQFKRQQEVVNTYRTPDND